MKLKEAIKLHKGQGRHFFDISAMRFFDSKLESDLIEDLFFITSEQYNYDHPRLYTIRKFSDDYMSINTIGEFQEYKTKREAVKGVKEFIEKNIDAKLYQNKQTTDFLDTCYETVKELIETWDKPDSWLMNSFSMWLDGSYNGQERYKRMLEHIKHYKYIQEKTKTKLSVKITDFVTRELNALMIRENQADFSGTKIHKALLQCIEEITDKGKFYQELWKIALDVLERTEG